MCILNNIVQFFCIFTTRNHVPYNITLLPLSNDLVCYYILLHPPFQVCAVYTRFVSGISRVVVQFVWGGMIDGWLPSDLLVVTCYIILQSCPRSMVKPQFACIIHSQILVYHLVIHMHVQKPGTNDTKCVDLFLHLIQFIKPRYSVSITQVSFCDAGSIGLQRSTGTG